MLRMNCWDYKKCSDDLRNGCPAYPNAGRVCFVVEGTRCDGMMQGCYSEKIHDCRECGFYRGMVIRKAI
jgi:hypothetical protein